MAGPSAEIAEMGESSAEPLTVDAKSAVAEPKAHGFKEVQFAWSQILCRGGKNNKPLPIQTMRVPVKGMQHHFAKLTQKEAWLCKAVTGQACPQRTSIGRTTLLDQLKARLKDAADGKGGVVDAELVYDPMNEVDGGCPPPAEKKQKRNWRKDGNKARNTCIVTDFPSKCPEMHPECTDTRSITLYVKDRAQIWLDLDDVGWAVDYMHDQNVLKGVASVPPEDTGPDGAGPAAPIRAPVTPFAEKLDASAEVPGVQSAAAEEDGTN